MARKPVPEAPLVAAPGGLVPDGDGWFVVNLADARAAGADGVGVYRPFEAPGRRFGEVGINVHVLRPGERSGLYHAEAGQEGFLVLSGEALLLVEEQERRLRAWDFVHCPPRTAHTFVGAGDEPCAILMVGCRTQGDDAVYPHSPVAERHAASAPPGVEDGDDAYPSVGWPEIEPRPGAPWPPR